MIDAGGGGLLYRRLAVVGDAEAGGLDHRDVVGAVADRERVVAVEPKRSRSAINVSSLASRPRIGSATVAGETAVRVDQQRIGVLLVEADRRGDDLR